MPSNRDMMGGISRMLEPIVSRIYSIISRALLESINDASGIQKVKLSILKGENRDNVERFQDYGFTSTPKAGAEAVVAFVSGNRDHGIVIKIDDRRYRLQGLEEGEVALYTDEGDSIELKRGGRVVVNSSNIELGSGSLESLLNGQSFQSLFNSHTHLGAPAGLPTSPPVVPSTPADLSGTVKAST